jgi:hypothetical protein
MGMTTPRRTTAAARARMRRAITVIRIPEQASPPAL